MLSKKFYLMKELIGADGEQAMEQRLSTSKSGASLTVPKSATVATRLAATLVSLGFTQ